jgi:uncharacterized iron-regulated membrane protein
MQQKGEGSGDGSRRADAAGQRKAVAPPRPTLVRVPAGTWITAVALGVLFPLAGATLVAVAILDWAVARRVPALGRALR